MFPPVATLIAKVKNKRSEYFFTFAECNGNKYLFIYSWCYNYRRRALTAVPASAHYYNMAQYSGVSNSVIRRLPRYYRYLRDLMDNGVERISSREFAGITGLTASQIRQDLNCFGGFGQQGYGYNVGSLYSEIGRILAVDKEKPTILIGAGNMGMALAYHMEFSQRGFSLIGIFDNDREKIGKKIKNWTIMDSDAIPDFCSEHHPLAAVLCIPKQYGAGYAEMLADCGIKGLWNFSHQDLSSLSHKNIVVENVHLGDSLMTLSFQVNETL